MEGDPDGGIARTVTGALIDGLSYSHMPCGSEYGCRCNRSIETGKLTTLLSGMVTARPSWRARTEVLPLDQVR